MLKHLTKTLIPLLIVAVVFFYPLTVSAATISSGSTFSATDGTSGKLIINSVNSSISQSSWNVSVNFTINMVNSWLYTGGADYERYFSAVINGVNGGTMQIKTRTESWSSGTSRTFTYNMSLPVNPDENILSARFRVADGNNVLNDVATFDTGNNYTVNLKAVQKATALSINVSSKTLYTQDTFAITPTVLPTDTYDKDVAYVSNNSAIASVSSNGVITAKKAGSATITVSTKDGSAISKTLSITVLQYVTSITANLSSPVVYTGETIQLSTSVSPVDASNKAVSFTSADTSIATINDSGLISGIKAGSTTITIHALDGSNISKTLSLTVQQKAKNLTITNPVTELYKDTTYQLCVDVLPIDTTDSSVSFSSSDPTIASVSESGLITPLKRGSVTVSVRTQDSSNLNVEMTFTVKQYVKNIILSESSIHLYTGDHQNIIATILPEDADNKEYCFTSSNPSIATVTSDGKVAALKAGSTDIIVSALDGSGVTKALPLTVEQKAMSISVSNPINEIDNGTTYQLNVIVLPEDTTDKSVEFVSSNPEIATISNTGLITPHTKGKVTITVSTKDSSALSASITLNVKQHVEHLMIEPNLIIYTGESKTLIPEILPVDADNQSCIFTSSDSGVVSVNESGKITALKVGLAVITVQSLDDNNMRAECQVIVNQYAEVIDIGQNQIDLASGTTYQITTKVLPEDTSDSSLNYTSSERSVACVDESGLITAVNPGTAKIIVTATDRGSVKKILTVRVTRMVATIDVLNDAIELYSGESISLDYIVYPNDATNKKVSFHSDNTDVASIDKHGKITAHSAGDTMITIQAIDGSHACQIVLLTVRQSITSLTMEDKNITLSVGDTYCIDPIILPETAYNKNLSYESSNPGIVGVDGNGKVTAYQVGTSVIKVKSTDGSNKEVKITFRIVQKCTESKFKKPINKSTEDTSDTSVFLKDKQDIDCASSKSINDPTMPVSSYEWYEYVFVGMGCFSFTGSLVYFFLILFKEKKKKENDNHNSKLERNKK